MKTLGPKSTVTQNLLVEVENTPAVTVDSGSITVDGTLTVDNPIIVKGVYVSSPATLTNGEDGYILLTSDGLLATQDKSYDAITDSNKVIPVVQAFDHHEYFSHSRAVATDAAVIHYVDARTFPFWAIIWSTPDGYVDITIAASNETTEPDLTLRDYVDITADLGGPFSIDAVTSEKLAVTTPLLYDSYRFTYTPTGLTTWVAEGKKGSF